MALLPPVVVCLVCVVLFVMSCCRHLFCLGVAFECPWRFAVEVNDGSDGGGDKKQVDDVDAVAAAARMDSAVSVTRWLDYFAIFVHLQQ